MHIVLDNPGIMLCEIQREILSTYNTPIAESTICQTLHQLNFSRKKMRIAVSQQDDLLRRYFASEIKYYSSADMFVFLVKLAQTGMQVWVWLERKAYCISKLLIRGQHLSTMAFISTAGLLDCATVTGGVNGDVFYEFVHKSYSII